MLHTQDKLCLDHWEPQQIVTLSCTVQLKSNEGNVSTSYSCGWTSQWRWIKLELQVTSAQDLWADEWLICLTTDYYRFLMCLALYAVHLMAPFFVIPFLHIVGCFTLTHQWWQQQEASIPITKIKHTYQYHASRFASIQRRTRKFYFASDHHTQAVIHVY